MTTRGELKSQLQPYSFMVSDRGSVFPNKSRIYAGRAMPRMLQEAGENLSASVDYVEIDYLTRTSNPEAGVRAALRLKGALEAIGFPYREVWKEKAKERLGRRAEQLEKSAKDVRDLVSKF